MSLGVSFEAYLRRRWDRQKDVTTTSSRRRHDVLLPGGRYAFTFAKKFVQKNSDNFKVSPHFDSLCTNTPPEEKVDIFTNFPNNVDVTKCRNMSEVKNIPSLANQELHFMLFINKKVGVVIGLPL